MMRCSVSAARTTVAGSKRGDGPDTLMAAMGYMDPNNVRPRLTELKQAGLVRVIGKARNRHGKSVAVWEAQDV